MSIFVIKKLIFKFIQSIFRYVDKPFVSLCKQTYKILVFFKANDKEEYNSMMNMRSWNNRDDFSSHVFLSRLVFLFIIALTTFLLTEWDSFGSLFITLRNSKLRRNKYMNDMIIELVDWYLKEEVTNPEEIKKVDSSYILF